MGSSVEENVDHFVILYMSARYVKTQDLGACLHHKGNFALVNNYNLAQGLGQRYREQLMSTTWPTHGPIFQDILLILYAQRLQSI